jgi:hypothetical protein
VQDRRHVKARSLTIDECASWLAQLEADKAAVQHALDLVAHLRSHVWRASS